MDKICPLAAFGGNMHTSPSCATYDCEWWCEFANSCSIPLLAGMFADSTICRNVFDGNEKEN